MINNSFYGKTNINTFKRDIHMNNSKPKYH